MTQWPPAPDPASAVSVPADWYPDPDAGARPGDLRYWDGHAWTEHRSAPPTGPPPPGPPPGYAPPFVGARQPVTARDVERSVVRWTVIVAIAFVIGVPIAIGFGLLAANRTDSRAGSPRPASFPAARTATPVDLRARLAPVPSGYAIAPTADADGAVDARTIATASGSASREIASALEREGFVTGWRRELVSLTGGIEVRVSVYQMASAAGAADYRKWAFRPWWTIPGGTFEGSLPGLPGAAVMATAVPNPLGEFRWITATSTGPFVVQVEVRAPDQTVGRNVLMVVTPAQFDRLRS